MEAGNTTSEGASERMEALVIASCEEFKQQRPLCAECGTTPQSRGGEWSCPNCGHRWVKIRRQCKDCPYKVKE